MNATVLLILCEGEKTLAVYDNDAAAWTELVGFVDRRWPDRFGPIAPPSDEAQRASAFFRSDEMYVVASADLSDLQDHMGTDDHDMDWLQALRLR